jgi:hypothetical protein
MTERLEQLHQILDDARAEVRKVILGQDAALDLAMIVILARQHALIEGVPGVAKTLLARTRVHFVSTGRRDQSRAREDPIGAAPGHAGTRRHHRPRDA